MKIYFNQVVSAISVLTPYLKKITEEKIIPWTKKQYYKFVNKSVSKMLKKLTELGEKALTTEDEVKKERHKIGFKLGYEFVCSLETVVISAKQTLKEINFMLNGEDLIGEDEIPF